jgi:hypothetical protein
MTMVRRGAAFLCQRGSPPNRGPHRRDKDSPTVAHSATYALHKSSPDYAANGLGQFCPIAQIKPESSLAIAVQACNLFFPRC